MLELSLFDSNAKRTAEAIHDRIKKISKNKLGITEFSVLDTLKKDRNIV